MAECSYLARVDKFKVLEDGHKDQRSTIADVYQRHIRCANGFPLPERFDVLHIGMERILVNVLSGSSSSSSNGAHFSLPSHSFPNIEIRLNLMAQYIIWVSLL